MASSNDAAAILAGAPVKTKNELQKILESNATTKVAANVAISDPNKLRGMHRELYALVGGRPPLAQSSGYTNEKAKLLAKAPASKWRWTPFKNKARKDDLMLSHWVKAGDEKKDYPFAKFNKLSRIPVYSRDDYLRNLTDEDWTEQETTLLLSLCRRFDLRFMVVHDRYNLRIGDDETKKQRTIEDLKDRYYSIAAKLAEIRSSRPDRVDVTYRFDAAHETKRKDQLLRLSKRTFAQIHEEALLSQELKKINQYKRESSSRVGSSSARRTTEHSTDRKRKHSVADLKRKDMDRPTKILITRPNEPSSSYLRSSVVHRTLPLKAKQAQLLISKSKERGIPEFPMSTASIDAAYDSARLSILEHIQLQTSIDHKKYDITQLQAKQNPNTKLS